MDSSNRTSTTEPIRSPRKISAATRDLIESSVEIRGRAREAVARAQVILERSRRLQAKWDRGDEAQHGEPSSAVTDVASVVTARRG